MKPLKVTVSERTLKKIIDLSQQSKYPEEQIVEMSLILGMSQLKKWLEEDD